MWRGTSLYFIVLVSHDTRLIQMRERHICAVYRCWFCGLDTLGDLLQSLVGDAWRHIVVSVRTDIAVKEMSFHEFQGLRITGTRELVLSKICRFRLRVLHLDFNATRYVTVFFLKASRDLHSPCEPCAALDFLNPKTSPATVATQYMGSLVRGVNPHLQMLWGPPGCVSWVDFVLHHPEEADYAAASFFCVSSSLHRRFVAVRKLDINPLLIMVGIL